MRRFKSTSTYPAYTHTSYNLEREGRVKVRLSFHVKHAFGGGGFWLGLRPEIEITRRTDKVEAFLAEMRGVEYRVTCSGCGAEGWSRDNWRRLGAYVIVCSECFQTKTLADLKPRY